MALHPAGFSVPRRSRAGRWSLTPPFHPYRTLASPAVYSLWHFPSARLETCFPHVLPCGITWRRVLRCSDFPLPVARQRSSIPLELTATIPRVPCKTKFFPHSKRCQKNPNHPKNHGPAPPVASPMVHRPITHLRSPSAFSAPTAVKEKNRHPGGRSTDYRPPSL